MSRPRFMVFKLNDLKLPFIMFLLVVAAFSFFLSKGDRSQETFTPDTGYQDGLYIANMAFSDANIDVVVTVAQNEIVSIALDHFDDTERILYQDLSNSIVFVNDYITATQSLELPSDSIITPSTTILMDAVAIALSNDENAQLKTTYQTPLLEQINDEAHVLEDLETALEDNETSDEEPTK